MLRANAHSSLWELLSRLGRAAFYPSVPGGLSTFVYLMCKPKVLLLHLPASSLFKLDRRASASCKDVKGYLWILII